MSLITPHREGLLCLVVALNSTFGYLLATLPPTMIDPLLPHRASLGALSYSYGWLIWPIALVLFVATLLLMYSAPANLYRLVATVVPLGVACIASLFILRPPFPHPNLLFMGTVWTSITAAWILIRYSLFHDNADMLVGVDKEACLQFIREQLEFSRLFLLGLVGAYIGLIVTALNDVMAANTALFTKPVNAADAKAIANELLLVNNNSFVQFSVISLFVLFGPIVELARRRRQLSLLFLSIRSSSEGRN